MDSNGTSDAPKGIAASYALETDGRAHPSSAVLFPFAPVTVASTVNHSFRGETAKKGQSKNPYRPSWYTARNIYSDKTLYNKVGIPQMEAFLIGEGVDIAQTFPKGPYYIQQRSKRVKVNRGDALIDMVKVVHQRVIDRRRAGHPVGPNQAPHPGARDWETQIAAFDSGNGLGTVAGINGSAFEATSWEEDVPRANHDDHAPASWDAGEAAQVRDEGHARGTAPSAFAPGHVAPPAPQYMGNPLPAQPNNVASQQLNRILKDLRSIKDAIMSEFEHVSKAVESGEEEAATYLELDNDTASERVQAKTSEIERLIRDSQGRVVISAEAQALVRRIIDLGVHYINIDRRFKEKNGNKAKLVKEAHDTKWDFQRARSDLMQQITDDVVWERFVPRAGYKVAFIVREVFPVDPLKVLE
ncbi:uncharacterized protein N0V89_006863 [Didymosphaeria variabile]|uniref:Uncharacterized protein n=1 Tax=Didymosphaeria variabile TaxID=1932322 RepID=A0A9W9C9M4_9PLEO|nr:uncharacterized protein N0V89_006863 [Didymosphaeria variabile]KAJ4351520.1 hypothetical protein N0V89_006863 [Didymosphaeria variabile]